MGWLNRDIIHVFLRKFMKTNKKATPNANVSEQDHYNGILLEDINSKIDLLVEGLQASREETHKEIGEFRKEVNDRFEVLESVVRQNSTDIKTNSTDIKKLISDVRELKIEMKDVHTEIVEVEQRLSDKIDILTDSHEKRLTVVENKLSISPEL